MSGPDSYDAIVIGGGPNGLLCAAYLARAGQRVLLLERRHETGGGLNTDEYYGFRLNLHAIYHMMAEAMPANVVTIPNQISDRRLPLARDQLRSSAAMGPQSSNTNAESPSIRPGPT